MSERSFEPDPLDELREILGAAQKFAAATPHAHDDKFSTLLLLDNAWAGGHGGSGSEAIELGF